MKNIVAEIKNKWWIPVAIIAFIWGVISGAWWITALMIVVFVLTFLIYLKKKQNV
ncbi:MAG TPA: hypothetical protein VJH04_04095 [archaeon]|nr:hypothetical protein [archaeon]